MGSSSAEFKAVGLKIGLFLFNFFVGAGV